MSMTVQIALKGLTELDLLLNALQEMNISAKDVSSRNSRIRGSRVLATARIRGRQVGFARKKNGEIAMVGDGDWPVMQDEKFKNRLRQHYSVAAVKKKAAELRYSISSVSTLEDGSIRILARAWG